MINKLIFIIAFFSIYCFAVDKVDIEMLRRISAEKSCYIGVNNRLEDTGAANNFFSQKKEINENKTQNPAKTFWKLNELKVYGDCNDCLVKESGSDKCLINVAQFNAAIEPSTIAETVCKDSARIAIIRQIASDIYLAQLAEESGYTENAEVKIQLAERRKLFKYSQQYLNCGSLVFDKNILYSTYQKYFDALFNTKEDVFINIIGSTDSVYIDSVYSWLSAITKNDFSTSAIIRTRPIFQLLPWQRSDWRDLPDTLVTPVDSMYTNEFTRPIKTEYGFFIAQIDAIKKRRLISFEDAYIDLIYLATRDKWLNIDSIKWDQAYQVYQKNKNEYVTPDTMQLSISLLPGFFNYQKMESNIKADNADIPVDTASLHWIEISSLLLPEELQKKIKQYYPGSNINTINGPVYTRYGTLYFRVLTTKQGRKQLSFDQVGYSILAELDREEKKESLLYSDEQERYIDRMLYGNMYYINEISKIQNMCIDEIMQLANNGTIDMSGVEKYKLPKNDCFLYARNQYVIMKINEFQERIDQWVNTLNINMLLLKSQE